MASSETAKGSCTGSKHGAVFELVNGQVWKQTINQYSYSYQYRPTVEIDELRGTLKHQGMSDFRGCEAR